MASIFIIVFLVVMGFQVRDQSYSECPEFMVLMDDGMVVDISNFLVRISHRSCFISSLLLPGGFT